MVELISPLGSKDIAAGGSCLGLLDDEQQGIVHEAMVAQEQRVRLSHALDLAHLGPRQVAVLLHLQEVDVLQNLSGRPVNFPAGSASLQVESQPSISFVLDLDCVLHYDHIQVRKVIVLDREHPVDSC